MKDWLKFWPVVAFLLTIGATAIMGFAVNTHRITAIEKSMEKLWELVLSDLRARNPPK